MREIEIERVPCQRCRAVVKVYGDRAERRKYCSQRCSRKAGNEGRSVAATNSVDVDVKTREMLGHIDPENSDNYTIVHLMGWSLSRGEPGGEVDTGDQLTTVLVSDGVYRHLRRLQRDWQLENRGEVIAVLVDQYE